MSSPGSDECGEMVVLLMHWDGVIPVPSVEQTSSSAWVCLELDGKGTGCDESWSSMGVQWLEVYHTPGFSIRFSHNHYPLAPSVRSQWGLSL